MLKDVNLKIAQLKIMATHEVHSCSNCGKKDKFKNDPHETCSTLLKRIEYLLGKVGIKLELNFCNERQAHIKLV
jgi:predicted metal-binding protein